MTVKPIIFSGPMVRALLAGTKTQTRRVLKPQPPAGVDVYKDSHDQWRWEDINPGLGEGTRGKQTLPYFLGDLIYVRETAWYDRDVIDATDVGSIRCFFEGGAVRFEDGRSGQAPGHPETHTEEMFDLNGSLVKRPSIHMPRWASRLCMEVTRVRVERVQDISEDDAKAEGMIWQEPTAEDEAWNRAWAEEEGREPDPMEGVWLAPGSRQGFGMTKEERERPQWGPTAATAFRWTWDAINAKRGYGWDGDPWVVVVEWEKVIHRNVDDYLSAVVFNEKEEAA